MKKTLITSFFITLIIFFCSCSIEQEITFLENNQINYKMLIDGSKLMKSSGNNGITTGNETDSIISFADIVRRDNPKLLKEYPELEKDVDNISQLYMHIIENPAEQKFSISIYGNFKDSKNLNQANASLYNLMNHSSKVKGGKTEEMSKDLFSNTKVYTWNGKVMTHKAEKKKSETTSKEEDKDRTHQLLSNIGSYILGNTTTIKYHFPRKVKSVSDPEALLSQDGKSVIIKYPNSILSTTPELANIRIELE